MGGADDVMQLFVVATGSTANTYVLSTNDGESLILDAGVPFKKVLPHIPDVRKISACLITHEHADHARAWAEYAKRGIPLVLSEGTNNALSANVRPTRELQRISVGSFIVMPFMVQHDAAEPFGFLVQYAPTGETLLYATDTYYLRYTFPGVNYWVIECNYCEDLVDGETNLVLRNRLKESHMGLGRLLDVFASNDMLCADKIVLVHLSDKRSNENVMQNSISAQTGVETVAARAGMTINLESAPF